MAPNSGLQTIPSPQIASSDTPSPVCCEGSWTLSPEQPTPTSITLDPNNVNHLWVVDSTTDRVYQYDAGTARTTGSQVPSTSFPLAAGNANVTGIADPLVLRQLANTQSSDLRKNRPPAISTCRPEIVGPPLPNRLTPLNDQPQTDPTSFHTDRLNGSHLVSLGQPEYPAMQTAHPTRTTTRRNIRNSNFVNKLFNQSPIASVAQIDDLFSNSLLLHEMEMARNTAGEPLK